MKKPIFLKPVAPMSPAWFRELSRSQDLGDMTTDELELAFPGWRRRVRLTRRQRERLRELSRR